MASLPLAFLGTGRMATAMVQGLLAEKRYRPEELLCLGGAGTSARRLAEATGVSLARDLSDLAAADTLVVAFKPQHLAGADPRLADLTRGKLVVSVLAGKPLARLGQTFPHARNLVRAMPNTPGQIGAGVTGWCAQRPLDAADAARLESLLGALGRSLQVEETQMDALTAVSGSGPAYVFEFVAALRDAGVSAGLPRAAAAELALETVLGAARLLARTRLEPEALRDQVTSPNGTTLAGLRRLEANRFRPIIEETVRAARTRSEELSREG